jgi:putative tricarboxylic transport membrane protein
LEDVVLALWHALFAVLKWQNVLAMMFATLCGVVIGALPGLSATIGISVLIPLTFGMDPMVALGMMAGIYNGSMYGGAIPAVLLKIPGTPSAIVTTFDGFPMSQQGKSGAALKIACISSALGGMVSAVALMTLAPPLSLVTLAFGPAEYFWVAVFGLASVSVLLGRDPIKGALSATFGLLIGTLGTDLVTGHERYTFGVLELTSGLHIVVVLVGLYAMPRVLGMAEDRLREGVNAAALKFSGAKLGYSAVRRFWKPWTRASIIGIIVGILPGAGGNIAAFVSYNETKRASKDPDSFGKGNPEGVAAAECANNADNAAAMIPALTLGVPGNSIAALILGGLLVHGLQPGPALFRENADIVYGFMIQMFLTSVMVFVFGGLIASRIFAQALRLPQVMLAPLIVGLMIVGVYSVNNSMFDLYVMMIFGLIGYVMEKLDFPLAPAVLGLILGNMAEINLRLALLISRGDESVLFTRPISQVIILLVLLVLFYPVFTWWKARRKTASVPPH